MLFYYVLWVAIYQTIRTTVLDYVIDRKLVSRCRSIQPFPCFFLEMNFISTFTLRRKRKNNKKISQKKKCFTQIYLRNLFVKILEKDLESVFLVITYTDLLENTHIAYWQLERTTEIRNSGCKLSDINVMSKSLSLPKQLFYL